MAGIEDGRLLEALERTLTARGAQGWLVGGTVRDRLLGRTSPDTDVVVEADPRKVAAEVAEAADRPWFALSHEFGAYRLVGEEGYLDLAGLRGGDLETDLALRDFTINAMATPLRGGRLIDPFGGRRDLDRRVLVPVSESVFADDPLRLMRAARFAHVLGMSLTGGVERLIVEEAWRLPQAAPERVMAEVVLTLEGGRTAAAVCLWSRVRLLERVFPDVADMEAGSPHAYRHLLAALDAADEVLERPGALFGRAWEALERRLGRPVDGQVSRPVALRLATLVHEGEPEDACRRLRCSQALASLLRVVTASWSAVEYLDHDSVRERDRVAFLRRAAPFEPECLMVAAAHGTALTERPGAAGGRLLDEPTEGGRERGSRTVRAAQALMDLWRRRLEGGVAPLPLDGTDIMSALGVEPGPLLGEVLWETSLAWEAGEVTAREEAMEHAERYLDRRREGRSS